MKSVAILTIALVGAATWLVPGRAPASVALVAAANRCNAKMINDYESQIRAFDRNPAPHDPAKLRARYQEIDAVLQSLTQEREILESICTEDQKAPLAAQVASAAAWGLALQADIADELGAPCPPAAKAMAEAMLAQGWLNLANVVNGAPAGASPPPAAMIGEVVPKIQTRAQALGLALPAYAQTSAYWTTTQSEQAKAAVAACPPLAAPSPNDAP